jgi:hypothetical protein
MFATSTLTFKSFSFAKYPKIFHRIPKCEKCLHFFPKEIQGNDFDQCKIFGFVVNNKTNEISYDNVNKQRTIGQCGPNGKYFETRRKNFA